MTTASDMITRAARTLGYLGRTEVLSAADANDGLLALNAMLGSWSNEFLLSYATNQRSFTLTPGTQTYTIGSGGTINSTRPFDITGAFVRDSNNNDYGMAVIPIAQWDAIGLKTITSQIPDTLYYDSQYPLGIINIFPVPLLAYTVFFDSTIDQALFTALTTDLAMPVGYERAYILNLALEMMVAGFPCLLDERGLSILTMQAAEAKGNIKRANIKEMIAEYDEAIVSRSDATFNIYSGGWPRG